MYTLGYVVLPCQLARVGPGRILDSITRDLLEGFQAGPDRALVLNDLKNGPL